MIDTLSLCSILNLLSSSLMTMARRSCHGCHPPDLLECRRVIRRNCLVPYGPGRPGDYDLGRASRYRALAPRPPRRAHQRALGAAGRIAGPSLWPEARAARPQARLDARADL